MSLSYCELREYAAIAIVSGIMANPELVTCRQTSESEDIIINDAFRMATKLTDRATKDDYQQQREDRS
jgi:hypothetical protein